ncbi:hypothetical protein KKA47_02105 [bacterium]|nr:hypothetical protein [bacterium]
MKRISVILLSLLFLTACSGSDNDDKSGSSNDNLTYEDLLDAGGPVNSSDSTESSENTNNATAPASITDNYGDEYFIYKSRNEYIGTYEKISNDCDSFLGYTMPKKLDVESISYSQVTFKLNTKTVSAPKTTFENYDVYAYSNVFQNRDCIFTISSYVLKNGQTVDGFIGSCYTEDESEYCGFAYEKGSSEDFSDYSIKAKR